MKQETKVPESKLLHFDANGYEKVKNVLFQLAKSLNEVPVLSYDPLSIRALERRGLFNDCFKSICQEAGVEPDETFFISALKSGAPALSDKITESVDPLLKAVVISSNDKLLRRFQSVVDTFKSRLTAEVHYLFIQSMKILKLESYITFSDGFATITDECLNELKESFKSYLDSSSKIQALELLNELARITNQVIKLQQDYNLVQVKIDTNYLTQESTGEMTPNYELLKYC